MSVKIPPEIAKRIQELKPQVMNLDLFAIMELGVIDYADWIVSDYIDICREEAEEEALTSEQFTESFRNCVYESIGVVEEKIRERIYKIVESATILFSKFFNYELPETLLENYYKRAQEILQEYLMKFIKSPQNPQLYVTTSSY